jgi:ribonucleoside-diphosphate reductase alpha chain
MRKPTGDQNFRCLNLHHGLNITDDFMELIEKSMIDPEINDDWNLVDPHSEIVVETISAKDLWQRILEMRMQTGEPYLHFIDTSNREMPKWLKRYGLKIHQSNLCSEIILPTNKDRTAVCCLSSVNLEYFDVWSKDKQFISDIAEMLDNVLTFFIDNAPDAISRAKYSAERERSIGLGALGFHAYLQKKKVSFESVTAKSLNVRMFRHIRKRMDEANQRLAKERGEAPDAEGMGRRFSHVMAIAPNASSSIIMGNTSPSVEPWRANAYRQDTLSGAYLNKNKLLDALIKNKCQEDTKDAATEGSGTKLDYDRIWRDIIASEGSVQQLKGVLTDDEKDIYKTSMEIDQRWVIEHAADRQKFVDQAQSINVFFRPDTNIKYLHAVHFLAWKSGLKTLYYCRSEKIGKADKVSRQIERHIIKEINLQDIAQGEACIACEG